MDLKTGFQGFNAHLKHIQVVKVTYGLLLKRKTFSLILERGKGWFPQELI